MIISLSFRKAQWQFDIFVAFGSPTSSSFSQFSYAGQVLPLIPSKWSFSLKREPPVRDSGGCHYTSFVPQH